MKKSKWILFAVAVGLMALTAGFLGKIRAHQHLGQPGVRVGAVSIYDTDGRLVSSNSVVLPDEVMGGRARSQPITTNEVWALPRDTTFGRCTYLLPDGFGTMISVVLMGADRTSIHQPQFCLVAQGWSIVGTDHIHVPMQRPMAYDLPAVKLSTSMRIKDAHGQLSTVHGVYIYWFVSGDNITGDQGERLWSIARTMLTKGYLERWAYISYFATCLPGQDEATCQRLEKFIQASAPDFQVVTGQPSGRFSAVASGKMSPN
ncbi:MAG TPA: exosortase-associated EpsI family protein [Candidatus Saccharimonadales bacterium]|nr:exosortase-associated EpsI family protein [Candidatus Saccharimonadales bacterium]